MPCAQGVGRSNRPAPTNGFKSFFYKGRLRGQLAMFGGNIDADQPLQRYVPEAIERQRLYRDAQSAWEAQMKSQARREGKC